MLCATKESIESCDIYPPRGPTRSVTGPAPPPLKERMNTEIDIDRLHEALERRSLSRGSGKTTAMCEVLAGYVGLNLYPVIYVAVEQYRDLDHIKPMLLGTLRRQGFKARGGRENTWTFLDSITSIRFVAPTEWERGSKCIKGVAGPIFWHYNFDWFEITA